MDLYTGLVIMHVIGAALGTGAATIADIAIVRALHDGVLSPDERSLLRAVYFILRVGLVMAVVSGLGFLAYYYAVGATEALMSEKLWAKMTIVFILVLNGYALHKHWVTLLWGAAISLTSWYAALVLGAMRSAEYSYISVMFWYGVALLIVYAVERYVHKRFIAPPPASPPGSV